MTPEELAAKALQDAAIAAEVEKNAKAAEASGGGGDEEDSDDYLEESERELIKNGAPIEGDDESTGTKAEDEAEAQKATDDAEAIAVAKAAEETAKSALVKAEPDPMDAYADTIIAAGESIKTAKAEVDKKIEELSAIAGQYDQGDLTTGEYDLAKLKIEREIKALDDKIATNTRASDEAANKIDLTNNTRIEKAQAEFAELAPRWLERPENKIIATDPVINKAMNEALTRITDQGRGVGRSAEQILAMARLDISFDHALPAVGAAAAAPAAKPAVKKQPVQIPPSLGDLSQVQQNQTGEGEFEHIDKLQGDAYDDAIAAMDEKTLKRFLSKR